jgi:hypothetical protein
MYNLTLQLLNFGIQNLNLNQILSLVWHVFLFFNFVLSITIKIIPPLNFHFLI